MDEKLYLEKLSEVAEWHWGQLKGDTNRSFRRDPDVEELEPPKEIVLDSVKRPPCEYNQSRKGCHWTIYKKPYLRKMITIKQCDTCGALLTPKGILITKADQPVGLAKATIISQVDRQADK